MVREGGAREKGERGGRACVKAEEPCVRIISITGVLEGTVIKEDLGAGVEGVVLVVVWEGDPLPFVLEILWTSAQSYMQGRGLDSNRWALCPKGLPKEKITRK